MKRLGYLLVSIMLIVSMAFTFVFSACTDTKPDDTGSSNTGTNIVKPEPEPPVLEPTDPQDRTAYTLASLSEKVSDTYAKDWVNQNQASASLQGFLIGDVYTEVVNKALTAIEGSLPAGINLNAMGINVYRGNDGNWYRVYAENVVEVNSCLNGILNCKIDGSEKLTIDYSLYGEKTLAYIFFDYSEPLVNMDRNWLLKAVFSSSPLLSGIAYTTLNEAKTLYSGTQEERKAIIVKNFGEVSLSSLAGTFLPDTVKSNKFVAATLNVKISDIDAISSSATAQEALKTVAELYKGVSLGDVFGVSEGDAGYLREIHTMTVYGILNAAAEGTLKDYLLEYTSTLTLNKIIKAALPADEATQTKYEAFYAQYKAVLDTTVGDIAEIANKAVTVKEFLQKAFGDAYQKIKDVALVGSLTVGGMVDGITQNVITDENGAVSGFNTYGFVTYLLTGYKQDLDGAVIYNALTVGALVGVLQRSFTEDPDGNMTLDVTEFFRILEAEFAQDLDGASAVMANLTYAELKTKISALLSVDLSTYVALIDQYIKNNTVTDGQGGSTVNYLGALCDFYLDSQTQILNYLKTVLFVGVDFDSLNQQFGYDILDTLLFKGVRDNLDAVKQNPTTAISLVLTAYGQNIGMVLDDYMSMKGETSTPDTQDKVLFTYTANDGNVFDITAQELINLLKVYSDPTATKEAKKLALCELLGDAKVGTIIEALQQLKSSTPA